MRKATVLGKDVCLTEKQWSRLVRRFDLDGAKKQRWGTKFRILVGCFCCDFPCSRCPLRVLRWGEIYGCIRVISYFCGTSVWAFALSMNSVYWREEDDKKARKQVEKVYTALMGMKQVKYVKKG